MQHINDQIAALQKQLMGNSQDYSFGVISKAEYYANVQAISKQIGKLRDQLPSNLYSPEPTPGQAALVRLKNRVEAALLPYKNRINPKDWNGILIALKFSVDANQVERLYHTWQGRLALKNIAKLPDLIPYSKAA